MAFVFDLDKSEWNRRERGLPFDGVEAFDWASVYIVEDDRKDYGEARFRTFGLIEGRLHIAVFTPRGEDIRIISLRKANRKEERIYERETQRPGRTAG
jgi:uncharacterized DUF497 family protein